MDCTTVNRDILGLRNYLGLMSYGLNGWYLWYVDKGYKLKI